VGTPLSEIKQMLNLDDKHKKILNALNPQNDWITHTQLWKETGPNKKARLNKKTFHSKLYELVKMKLVKRKAKTNWKKGMKVWFRITSKGRKRVDAERILVEIKEHATNAYEEMIEKSFQLGERKALTSQVAFIISEDLPICTIAHFPSKTQYEKMKPILHSKEHQLKIGMLIDKLIEFYVSEKANEVYADYEPFKESLFTMSFLSKKQSETMRRAVENSVFPKYWQIMHMLNSITENTWLQIWNSLQDPKILKGEQSLFLANGFRYNPSEKKLERFSKNEVIKKLKNALPES
jgi:hypothetical protein